jgi:excisionase family DNA binding protein
MSKLLTLREVCERLRLHENTVREYINEGKIPAIKFDRVLRVEEEDLEEFLRTRRRKVKR